MRLLLWEKIKRNSKKHNKFISKSGSQDPLSCPQVPTLSLLPSESSMKMSLWHLIIRRMGLLSCLLAHLTRRVILSHSHSFRCSLLMSRIGWWGISWTTMKLGTVLRLSTIRETKCILIWLNWVQEVTQSGDSESMMIKWCSNPLPLLKLPALKTRNMQMKIFLLAVQSKRAIEGN